uniref:Uncharacterized protein n=1 Tax=Glossina brevipalpis TaxID=37001 RepID=A0A1A9W3D4_9MUSC
MAEIAILAGSMPVLPVRSTRPVIHPESMDSTSNIISPSRKLTSMKSDLFLRNFLIEIMGIRLALFNIFLETRKHITSKNIVKNLIRKGPGQLRTVMPARKQSRLFCFFLLLTIATVIGAVNECGALPSGIGGWSISEKYYTLMIIGGGGDDCVVLWLLSILIYVMKMNISNTHRRFHKEMGTSLSHFRKAYRVGSNVLINLSTSSQRFYTKLLLHILRTMRSF